MDKIWKKKTNKKFGRWRIKISSVIVGRKWRRIFDRFTHNSCWKGTLERQQNPIQKRWKQRVGIRYLLTFKHKKEDGRWLLGRVRQLTVCKRWRNKKLFSDTSHRYAIRTLGGIVPDTGLCCRSSLPIDLFRSPARKKTEGNFWVLFGNWRCAREDEKLRTFVLSGREPLYARSAWERLKKKVFSDTSHRYAKRTLGGTVPDTKAAGYLILLYDRQFYDVLQWYFYAHYYPDSDVS